MTSEILSNVYSRKALEMIFKDVIITMKEEVGGDIRGITVAR